MLLDVKLSKLKRMVNDMKDYYTTSNIGRAKYTVSYHDGISKHKDGSAFYNIMIFKSKVKMNAFIDSLITSGYKEKVLDKTISM